MNQRTLRWIERTLSPVLLALLRVLLPATGARRRAAPCAPPVGAVSWRRIERPLPELCIPAPRVRSPYAADAHADAEGTAAHFRGVTGRPYCPAEYWASVPVAERAVKRARRRALVAAAWHGYDLDRRDIHEPGAMLKGAR